MSDISHSSLPLHAMLRESVPRASVTRLLIGVNLLVFLSMLAGGAGLWHSSNAVQLAWGANFGPATQDGQWWRLGSAMFLHFGVVHLAMNMWALWDGGQLVERMYGPLRFSLLYLVSGLVGNLLSLVAHDGQAVSGGASGAIFGVYGALLVFLWRERRNLNTQEFRWLFWGAAGFSTATIVFGFLITGIDNAAHIGGFLSGLLFSMLLARPLKGAQRISIISRLFAGVVLVMCVATMISQIPAPAYRWSEEALARKEIGQFLRDDAAISLAWQEILEDGRRNRTSFDELAGRIDASVADRYAESFEQLSSIQFNPALPSSTAVEKLRRYAEQRRDASRFLAESLRTNDPVQIRRAFDLVKRSQPVEPPVAKPHRKPNSVKR